MELGEEDASGRRRPIATNETFQIDCDIITAIASHVDKDINCYGTLMREKSYYR